MWFARRRFNMQHTTKRDETKRKILPTRIIGNLMKIYRKSTDTIGRDDVAVRWYRRATHRRAMSVAMTWWLHWTHFLYVVSLDNRKTLIQFAMQTLNAASHSTKRCAKHSTIYLTHFVRASRMRTIYIKKIYISRDISNSIRLICTIFRHFVINTRQISCVRMADADSIELLSHSIVPFSLTVCVHVFFFDLLRLTHWSNKGSFAIEYFFSSLLLLLIHSRFPTPIYLYRFFPNRFLLSSERYTHIHIFLQ